MGSWAKICHNLCGLKPALIMVLVQAILALVNIGYKLAANDGMSLSVLVGYRFLFGAAFIVPVAYFAERKKRPKLTRRIVFHGFLCGLLGGSLGQNLYLKSLALTSATFASAITNLIPAITFVIAICLRLERLGWNTSAGKAKVFGTIIGLSGAMLLTFYKGPELNLWNTNINLLEITTTHHQPDGQTQNLQGGHNLVFGALLALGSCVCYSLWLIVQAKAAEQYPCQYSITAMMTVWASIQGIAFALCTERDWSSWSLGWNIRLLTVIVAGILGSGVMLTLVAWCVRMRGPHYVSIFNPLLLVIVAIVGSLLLEEKLHLGMLPGAILIVGGLYLVLWGKSKAKNQEKQVEFDMTSSPPSLATSAQGSSSDRGSSRRKEVDKREEEKRHSQLSTEIVGELCLYPQMITLDLAKPT